MRLAVIALSAFVLSGPFPLEAAVQSSAQVSQSFPVSGSWSGTFAGYEWFVELYEQDGALAGRYRTKDVAGWMPLQNVVYSGSIVEFQFASTRNAKIRLELDSSGDHLKGEYIIPDIPPIPLTFSRAK